MRSVARSTACIARTTCSEEPAAAHADALQLFADHAEQNAARSMGRIRNLIPSTPR
jgi:hypothetical protein